MHVRSAPTREAGLSRWATSCEEEENPVGAGWPLGSALSVYAGDFVLGGQWRFYSPRSLPAHAIDRQ